MFAFFRSAPQAAAANRHVAVRAQLAAWLLAGLSATATPAFAQDTTSFNEALQRAQARSRQLSAQDSATAAARSMALAAAQRPDPALKFGIANLPVEGADRFSLTRDGMTMRTIGVMQEFTREGKRVARARRFEEEAQAGEAARHLTLANLQRDTAMAWLDRYFQERMLTLVQSQRDEARLQIEAAQAAYRGGKGTQTDVISAHAALAKMDDLLAQTEDLAANARTQLSRWTGDAPDTPLGTAPNLAELAVHDTNIEGELARHPDIVLMRKQEDMAQADADAARADKQADWSVELMLGQRGPGYARMASVNVSVPLQWDQKNRQDRELAARLSQVEQMRAQREEAMRAHQAELSTWLRTWRSGRARLARYEQTLLPLAGERVQAAMAAYRGGTGTLSTVLEARRMDLDTHMESLRLEMDTARLWAQLQFLIPVDAGTSTPDTHADR